ncbi:MAG: hypothetical protein JXR83_14495 [Deltaproteobacteria bacterium]|nr:hypothetical protein [Deltaproteobacteria bacterium]
MGTNKVQGSFDADAAYRRVVSTDVGELKNYSVREQQQVLSLMFEKFDPRKVFSPEDSPQLDRAMSLVQMDEPSYSREEFADAAAQALSEMGLDLKVQRDKLVQGMPNVQMTGSAPPPDRPGSSPAEAVAYSNRIAQLLKPAVGENKLVDVIPTAGVNRPKDEPGSPLLGQNVELRGVVKLVVGQEGFTVKEPDAGSGEQGRSIFVRVDRPDQIPPAGSAVRLSGQVEEQVAASDARTLQTQIHLPDTGKPKVLNEPLRTALGPSLRSDMPSPLKGTAVRLDDAKVVDVQPQGFRVAQGDRSMFVYTAGRDLPLRGDVLSLVGIVEEYVPRSGGEPQTQLYRAATLSRDSVTQKPPIAASIADIRDPTKGARLEDKYVLTGRRAVVTATNEKEPRGFWAQSPGSQPEGSASAIFVNVAKHEPLPQIGAELKSVKGVVVNVGATADPAATSTQLIAARYELTGKTVADKDLPKPVSIASADAITDALEGRRVVLGKPGQGLEVVQSEQHDAVHVILPGSTDMAAQTDRGAVLQGTAEGGIAKIALPRTTAACDPNGRPLPVVQAGDRFTGPIEGVVRRDSYTGRLMVQPTRSEVEVEPGDLKPDHARLTAQNSAVTVANINTRNLNLKSSRHVGQIARLIADNAAAPNVVTLQEIQDDSGYADNGVVTSEKTLDALVAQIEKAGGPRYKYVVRDPEDNQEGGAPGGNIRNAVLYDPRVMELDAASVHRIDDADGAFDDSRKPLVARLKHKGTGQTLNFNVVHFTSRRGAGHVWRRVGQAQATMRDVAKNRQANPDDINVVLGDFNTYAKSPTATCMRDNGLVHAMEYTPPAERGQGQSYIHEGEAASLDQVFVDAGLKNAKVEYEILSGNTDVVRRFNDKAGRYESVNPPSDHGMPIMRIGFAKP